jgi:hypothetical protein
MSDQQAKSELQSRFPPVPASWGTLMQQRSGVCVCVCVGGGGDLITN